MADLKLSPEVRDVLKGCETITGNTKGVAIKAIKLPRERLAPKHYAAVKKALELLGGKWKTNHQAFAFETGNPAELLREALRSGVIVDKQKKFQAFYTPPALAAEVVRWADVKGQRVLEPSCGQMALVKECMNQGASCIDAIEIDQAQWPVMLDHDQHPTCELGCHLGDFLTFKYEAGAESPFARSETCAEDRFPRIVMNPPFTKGQDIIHVDHALNWLAPDGILVAIMLEDEFRPAYLQLQQRVINMGGLMATQSVPAGTFDDTNIKTRIFKVFFPSKACLEAQARASSDLLVITAKAYADGWQAPETLSAPAPLASAARTSPGESPDDSTKTTTVTSPGGRDAVTMKLTIPRTHLVAALAAVRNAANPKGAHPVLANVHIEAIDGKTVHLTTSNLDLTLRTHVVGADVNMKGETTVNAGLLHDLCKSFSTDRIILSLASSGPETPDPKPETLKLIAGDASFELATLAAGDFPEVPSVTDPKEFEIMEHELQGLLARTSFARGTDTKRAVLTASLIRLAGETFVVGLDGKRMAVEQGAPTTLEADLNLPAMAVSELLRLLSTDVTKPRTVKVLFNANQAQFIFGEHHLITKLVSGEFPDYTRIIPAMDDEQIVTVDRAVLLAAAARVALIADGIRLEFRNKSLHLSTHHTGAAGLGKSTESLLTTGKVEAACNIHAGLLVEALTATDAEEINLYPSSNAPLALHNPTSTWTSVIAQMK